MTHHNVTVGNGDDVGSNALVSLRVEDSNTYENVLREASYQYVGFHSLVGDSDVSDPLICEGQNIEHKQRPGENKSMVRGLEIEKVDFVKNIVSSGLRMNFYVFPELFCFFLRSE